MKKNGFVFIETIIAIVVLTSSLLLLYSTFTKLLQSEKTHVNYDDMAYIYRTWYIKNELKELNLNSVLYYLNTNSTKDFITIGTEYEDLFNNSSEKEYISKILDGFEVKQMILLKENRMDDIRRCILDDACKGSISVHVSDGMLNYLKNLSVDVTSYFILAVEYETCDGENNCRNYYSWVSV